MEALPSRPPCLHARFPWLIQPLPAHNSTHIPNLCCSLFHGSAVLPQLLSIAAALTRFVQGVQRHDHGQGHKPAPLYMLAGLRAHQGSPIRHGTLLLTLRAYYVCMHAGVLAYICTALPGRPSEKSAVAHVLHPAPPPIYATSHQTHADQQRHATSPGAQCGAAARTALRCVRAA